MKNGPYELVVAPEGYPGKKYRGRYAYEHIIAWWSAYGNIPNDGEIIHHKNGNRRDNTIENLTLMLNQDHTKHHLLRG